MATNKNKDVITLNLNLYQPRVANALGSKQTKFAVIASESDDVQIVDEDEAKDWLRGGYGSYRRVADVVGTHPAIMFGDWQEIRLDMMSEITKMLIGKGICDESITGVLFLA